MNTRSKNGLQGCQESVDTRGAQRSWRVVLEPFQQFCLGSLNIRNDNRTSSPVSKPVFPILQSLQLVPRTSQHSCCWHSISDQLGEKNITALVLDVGGLKPSLPDFRFPLPVSLNCCRLHPDLFPMNPAKFISVANPPIPATLGPFKNPAVFLRLPRHPGLLLSLP